jgi:hypothetical protein
MLIKNNSALLAVALLFFAGIVCAQVGVGAGTDFSTLDSTTEKEKKNKKPKPPDPYVAAIAKRFDLNKLELTKLSFRGYGRNELIKLSLISRQSGKPLKDLVRLRDKDTKFSDMAKQFKLDYPAIMTETVKVRKELDYEVAISSPAGDTLKNRIHYSSSTATSPSVSTATAVEISTAPARQ